MDGEPNAFDLIYAATAWHWMPRVVRENVLQVAAADDQEPVEAFPADAPDPALGVRSRLRRPHRRFDLRRGAKLAPERHVAAGPEQLVRLPVADRRVTTNPDGRWVSQQARNLLMQLDDEAVRPRFLIR